MAMAELVFKRNAKPGKRIKFSNYCLTCGDTIPANKDFCSKGCENDFYDDSHLERELDEALGEQEEIETMLHEEKKLKAGII